MPVFNLELKFDDSGALKSSKVLDQVTSNVEKTQKAFTGLSSVAAKAGDTGAKAAVSIATSMKDAAKQVVALVGAFKALEGMKAFVQAGIQSNAVWEQSKIGIASVIASVNKLQDAQGNILNGQQAYNAALGLAEQAMNRIKILGLETTATTEQLVAGFQQIIGPASAAGLSMEQTLKFTTSMVQSLGAIGIPFSQLSAEARSLLDGTIVPTQDRLAVTLGITGDMVRNWKEQGVLAEKLLEKMSAFAAAGDDVAKTWEGLTSNLKDSFDVIAATAGENLYRDLKESLMVIQSLLTSTEKGTSGISDDFKNIAAVLKEVETRLGQAILESVKSFAGIVKEANEALKDFDATEAMDSMATAIKTVAGAYIAMKAGRALATSEQIKGFAADAKATTVLQALTNQLTKYDTALHKKIADEQLAATAAMRAADADLTRLEQEKLLLLAHERRADALATRLIGTKNEERAEQVLTAVRTRLTAVNTQLEATERKLASSMTAVSTAARGATIAQAAWSSLKTATTAVLGLFGGPLGAAFTAGGAALTYFMTKQSEAEKYASSHADAIRAVSENLVEAGKATEAYTQKLQQMTQAQIEFELAAAQLDLRKITDGYETLAESVTNVFIGFTDSLDNLEKVEELVKPLENVENATSEQLKALRASLQEYATATGKIDEYKEAVEKYINPLIAAKQREEQLSQALKEKKEGLDKTAEATRLVSQETINAEKALQGILGAMTTQTKTGQDAYEAVMKLTDGTKSAKEAAKEQNLALIESARAHLVNAEAAAEAALATAKTKAEMLGIPAASDAMISAALYNLQRIQEARANFEERVTQWQAGDGGGGGTDAAKRKAEEAARVLEDLEDKIARLQKTEEQYNNDKLTAEMNELRNKYPQLTETINQYEAAQKKAWEDEGKDKAREKELDNLESQLAFYDELADLTGNYNASSRIQNRLIDEKVRKFKNLEGVSDDLVDDWERLARLQVSTDPFDGAYRGLQRFTAQYGNDAAQWENITYNFASDFESTTRGMFDDFLDTGKVSFDSLSDLFRQLLKDMAYQALVQPVVLSVVSGVAGAMGGGSAGGGAGAAGGSGGLTNSAMGLAQNYATGKLMQGLTGTGGMLSGLANSINAGAASMFPSLFAPSGSVAATNASVNALVHEITGTAGTLSQTTLLGTLGAAGMGFGLGSLGGSLLSGLLGTNSQSTSLGGGIGAGLGAAVGSLFPGIGTAVGGIVGGLLGSGIGGLFGGGGGPDPGMSIHSRIDLLRDYVSTIDTHRGRPMYNANAPGYNISSISWDGVPHSAAVQGADATAQVIEQALAGFDAIGQAVASLGNGALEASYQASLAANRYMTLHTHWEEDPINLEAHLEDVQEAFMERMYTVLAGTDISGLAIAADGMIANTFDEVSKSIADAIGFVSLGANLGEYQDDFEQAIGGKVLDMLNSMDTSSLNLNIDKSSLAGWQRAAQAIAAWNEVETALDAILNPADELSTALKAANLQFDGWINNLRQLGWQEKAIAEIEKQRAEYLEEYRDAIIQSLEQDIHLRQIALTSGRDSEAYAIQSLLYQQANELDEMITKTGEYSRYTANLINVQKAELAQLRLDRFLQKQVNAAEETVRIFENAADIISNALTDLWTGDKNLLGTRYDEALYTLEQTYMQAMSGDSDALQSLPQIGQTVLALAREQLATRGEYDRAFYDVHVMLSNAQAYSENQLSTQEALLETLHAELGVEQQVQLTTEQISLQINALRSELGAALNQVTAGQKMDEGRLGTPTGVYGSYYATESELLVAKVHSLNATAWEGRTDWTPASSKQRMLDDFGSVAEWYRQFGVYEGFASGGITPVNTPFWVGENGPELMMSSQSYGVLSNRDSIDLIAQDRAARMFDMSVLVDEIRDLKSLTRQILVKVDKAAYYSEKTYGYMRMWDAEGMPAAATV